MLSKKRILSVSVVVGLIAFIVCDISLAASNITAVQGDENYCYPSSCGNLRNISYPFRLKGDSRTNCSHPGYELACENDRTVLYLYSGKYYVEAIFYDNISIRIVDSGIEKDNCSSMPLYSLSKYNFSRNDPYSLWPYNASWVYDLSTIFFVECATPPTSDFPYEDDFYYVETSPCFNGSAASTASPPHNTHSYVLLGWWSLYDFQGPCSFRMVVPITLQARDRKEVRKPSFSEIHREMAKGFELSWFHIYCGYCYAIGTGFMCDPIFDYNRNHSYNGTDCYRYLCKGGRYHSLRCFFGYYGYAFRDDVLRAIKFLGFIMAARTFLGIISLFSLVINKLQRRHFFMDNDIEEFLQGQNNLVPIRYSYSDIKTMTKIFMDKLGQGGFGSVFKGILRSGSPVAIKMLGSTKGNGQDFINEVATIGRIHHVNVVQLIGFCAEGSKRALVYDFMPNGSLDKYIFPREEESVSLTWDQMYKIALGVARGIEYLHRGCDMQILHFDIKPHNILLDENFTPKISDFGLARLYPTDDSIVSVTAARGTIGYIAPEMFYKKFGGVSHKADVYSFGMLLMEMAGRRKNVNPHADNSSQIYFPSWIYDQLDQGENMEMGDATEDEKKIAKKMIVVALWCIQMKPVDRPSMNKVIEMLQGPVELLQMPPKPFLSSPERVVEDPAIEEESTICQSSSLSGNSMESITLNVKVN